MPYKDKTCDACGLVFAPTSGKQKRCSLACSKKKHKEEQRRWYVENRDEKLEKSHRNYMANRGKKIEQGRRWNAANPDKRLQYSRNWNAANPEKARKKNEKYRANNLESCQKRDRDRARRRYHRMGGNGYRRQWRFLLERDGPICGICGGALDPHSEEFHVDHIQPVSKGGTSDPDNLQLAHPACNIRKHDRIDLEDLPSVAPAPQLSLFEK